MENEKEEIAVYRLVLRKRADPAIAGTALISDSIEKIMSYYNAYLKPYKHHTGTIIYFNDGGRLTLYLPLKKEELENLIRDDGEPGIYVMKMTRGDYERFKDQMISIKGKFI